MDIRKESLKKHYEWNGKIEVVSRVPINSAEDLSLLPILRVLQNRVLKFRRTMTSLLNSQEETTLLPL